MQQAPLTSASSNGVIRHHSDPSTRTIDPASSGNHLLVPPHLGTPSVPVPAHSPTRHQPAYFPSEPAIYQTSFAPSPGLSTFPQSSSLEQLTPGSVRSELAAPQPHSSITAGYAQSSSQYHQPNPWPASPHMALPPYSVPQSDTYFGSPLASPTGPQQLHSALSPYPQENYQSLTSQTGHQQLTRTPSPNSTWSGDKDNMGACLGTVFGANPGAPRSGRNLTSSSGQLPRHELNEKQSQYAGTVANAGNSTDFFLPKERYGTMDRHSVLFGLANDGRIASVAQIVRPAAVDKSNVRKASSESGRLVSDYQSAIAAVNAPTGEDLGTYNAEPPTSTSSHSHYFSSELDELTEYQMTPRLMTQMAWYQRARSPPSRSAVANSLANGSMRPTGSRLARLGRWERACGAVRRRLA
jgi:hypothetical protein